MSLVLGIRYLLGWSMAADQTRERAEWPPHPDRVFMALAAAYFEGDRLEGERAALEWLEGLDPPGIAAGEAFAREVVTSYVPVNDITITKKGALSAWLAKIDGLDKAKESGLSLMPEFRTRQGRVFPVRVPVSAVPLGEHGRMEAMGDGMPRVYLVWDGVEVVPTHRAGLESLCGKATSLGHSASVVQMWVEDGGVEVDWRAVDDDWGLPQSAGCRLRVPFRGRLERLEEAFGEVPRREDEEEARRLEHEAATLKGAAGRASKSAAKSLRARGGPERQRPRQVPMRAYARRSECDVETGALAQSCFEPGFIAFCRASGPRLGLESVAEMVKAFRGLVQKACDPAPAWLTGHEADGRPVHRPHAAVVPLAFVGHEHADGEVMGLALAVPRGLSREDRRCLAGLLRHERHELCMGTLGRWELRAVDGSEEKVTLKAARWTGGPRGERVWSTVTPIVFDRHPRESWTGGDPPRVRAERQAAYWAEVESMIADACERIGLPRPASVVARADSVLAGVPRSDRFGRLLRKDGSAQRHTHATIEFGEPVVGPVLIAAGRYKGYGVCRPVRAGAGGER